jgi:hypothetical protein
MIGVSMILTIALCAIGFTVLYTALDGLTSDFISQTDETPTEPAEVVAEVAGQSADTSGAPPATEAPQPAEQQQPEGESPTPTPSPEGDTAEDGDFNPDFQIVDAGSRINFREGPSTATGILDTLDPGTPLEYLNEEAPTDSAADGERWMRFATEDGLEGWVREIDVVEFES